MTELTSNGADELGEPPLVGCMDIFVALLLDELARLPFCENLVESSVDGLQAKTRERT